MRKRGRARAAQLERAKASLIGLWIVQLHSFVLSTELKSVQLLAMFDKRFATQRDCLTSGLFKDLTWLSADPKGSEMR